MPSLTIPVKVNLEVEGYGQATACTIDIDTSKPLVDQVIAGLQGLDPRQIEPRQIEYGLYPQRWVVGDMT